MKKYIKNFIKKGNKYQIFLYHAITNFIFIFGIFYFNQHMRRHYLFKIFGQLPKPNYYIMGFLFIAVFFTIVAYGIFIYEYYAKNEKE
ncbi:hypothetical protein J2Z35_001108 [Acetoanaerobium pronyense]|uniref:Uncharacterized protein n=1 Tax=Acetoanaerobium pronyense TaxID=1482736 RepID=A0ABS4KHQ4_9FIRM|nr:hypothetical protein [Acetoanaerobium pronyense]